MMGSGTTLVEAKLLKRNAIGVDVNLDAVMVALNGLNFSIELFMSNRNEPIIKNLSKEKHGKHLNSSKSLRKVAIDSSLLEV